MVDKKEVNNEHEDIEILDLNLIEAMDFLNGDIYKNSFNISDENTEQTMKVLQIDFEENMDSLIKKTKEKYEILEEQAKENTDEKIKEHIEALEKKAREDTEALSKKINEEKCNKNYSAKRIAQVFSSLLNAELTEEQKKNHFWVMALDDDFRIKLTYTVSFEFDKKGDLVPSDILKFAVLNKCKKIVIASNYTGTEKFVKPSEEDTDFTNMLYHMCERMGIELIDNIILT